MSNISKISKISKFQTQSRNFPFKHRKKKQNVVRLPKKIITRKISLSSTQIIPIHQNVEQNGNKKKEEKKLFNYPKRERRMK